MKCNTQREKTLYALAVDTNKQYRQMPHDNNQSTAIRVEMSNKNEFVLATYTDAEVARKAFTELLSSVVIGGRDTYQLKEDGV